MSKFISPRLASLNAYVPGEQPKDMQYIKLNTNESPFPPDPDVTEAVRLETKLLNLYPDPTVSALSERLAMFYRVKKENIFVSNGSDEALSFAFMAFCDENTGVAFPDISYGFYSVFAQLYGLSSLQIPLCEDFTINPADYFRVGRTIFIANPNAPTGIALPPSDIENIVKYNSENIVVIDEAYVDFGGESAIPLTAKYDNLLVVRTFSKSRSMAGVRLGFAVGNKEIIADLEKIKYSTNPYNINRMTLAAGCMALDNDGYYTSKIREIIKNREFLTDGMKKLGFYATASKANFVFVKSPDIGGRELYLSLRESGILVRHFESLRIRDYIRITVGTREQCAALLAACEKILIRGIR